jgi:glucan phosphoethanolaminetransferase (alkaline phosphatase superfamily)
MAGSQAGTRGWRHALSLTYQRGFSWEGFGMLIGALITFVIVILVLYLINLLPIDGRAKQIARVVVIIIGIVSLLRYITF